MNTQATPAPCEHLIEKCLDSCVTSSFLLAELFRSSLILLSPSKQCVLMAHDLHLILRFSFQAAVVSGTISHAGALQTLEKLSQCPAPKCSATSTADQV